MSWVPIRERLISSLVTTLLGWLSKSIKNILRDEDVKNIEKKLKTKPEDMDHNQYRTK